MTRHPSGVARTAKVCVTFATTLAAALALSACGGGGDGPSTPEPLTQVPASALTSTSAYTEFARSLSRTETGEPLSVIGVTPPVSESALPLGLG